MEKDKITLQELSKMLNLSYTIIRTHLCCLEKYRIPPLKPTTYIYNYNFLLSLRDFYQEKSESIGKCYEKYKKVVAKLNKIIKLWEKIRANLY